MRLPTLFGCLFYLLSSAVFAGTWGEGKWGYMYWGSNTETPPTVAPQVSASGNGPDEISLTITNLLTGAENGWSGVTHFVVTCTGNDPVQISATNPVLTGLEPGTDYSCSIVAYNAKGMSPWGQFSATTDSMGGLPIWLLYQATQQG